MSKKLTQSFSNLNMDNFDIPPRNPLNRNLIRTPEFLNHNKLYKSVYGTENKTIINKTSSSWRPMSNNSNFSDKSRNSTISNKTSENLQNSNKNLNQNQEQRTKSLTIKSNNLPSFPAIKNKNIITPNRIDISNNPNNIKEQINHDPVGFNFKSSYIVYALLIFNFT